MALSTTVIASLKSISNVPVYIGQREGDDEQSIVISAIKLNELVDMYEDLYQFVHETWRNLPLPPDCERTFVIMWLISAEDYCLNHFSIKWEKATSNTFVHLWSRAATSTSAWSPPRP